MVTVLLTLASLRCGQREMPWRRQIFLMADMHIPSCSAASLIDVWKYCASSSYLPAQRAKLNCQEKKRCTLLSTQPLFWQSVAFSSLASAAFSSIASAAQTLRST